MNATTTSPPTVEPRMRTAASSERWLVLRHRLRVDGAGAPGLGGAFLLLVLGCTGLVATRIEIEVSGLEIATTFVRWFVGGVGVYLTAVHLPLYVSHGRTRREAAGQLLTFAALYAVGVSLIVTVGFAVERLVYRVAGWPQTLQNDHLFTVPDQYHLVMLEHMAVLGVWILAGTMLGAAFYRRPALGVGVVPVALVGVGAIEAATGPGQFGSLPPQLFDAIRLRLVGASMGVALTVAVVSMAVSALVTWWIVRDVPLRNRND